MNKKFEEDLVKLYDLVSINQKELGAFYGLIENEKYQNDEIRMYVDEFLEECELDDSKENYLALLGRLINLRDEQFVQVLRKSGNSEDQIREKRALAYLWTKNFHISRHEKLIADIEKKELLNPFYRELLRGIHRVGLILSDWQIDWNEHIIDNINFNLNKNFGENTMKFLEDNNLFDRDEYGNPADRSYSVLNGKNGKYEILTYAQFFDSHVNKVVKELEKLIDKLETLEDKDTNQKENYIAYLKSLKTAFGEIDKTMLLARWKDVDRAWMDITSPIQVGHPLEYYEDHYRKAVALEWDVRVTNPNNINAKKTYESIKYMYKELFEKIGKNHEQVWNRTSDNLGRIQLYIGRPGLYYASEFNGLFSAQVVPNDEQVSKERGKKIFAFADNILDAKRAKPFLKIEKIIFGDEFLQKERELVFKKEKIWHKVYEVSTIGHEFGHILWLDNDSETVMNKNGVFKNIEEFKATTGGLAAFFMDEDTEIKEYVFLDLIKRAIGLIAWKETGEVEPYYCEGLIHLKALFDSGVLDFDEKLTIITNDRTYEKLKNWYLQTYEMLANHYLQKRDAKEFLEKFAIKEDRFYMPKEKKINSFVRHYWNLYQDIGREIDETEDKKEWLSHS